MSEVRDFVRAAFGLRRLWVEAGRPLDLTEFVKDVTVVALSEEIEVAWRRAKAPKTPREEKS